MTEPNRQSGENEERIIEIEIERLRPFKEHPFQVKDGLVSEIAYSDFPGDSNVRFRTESGEYCANWFRIPNAGLKINTPILIAHIKVNRGMSRVVRKERKE